MKRDLLDEPIPAHVRALLSPMERVHFELALRMNREPVKALWTWGQRLAGALGVRLATRNLVRVQGFEHIEHAVRSGSVLFVANHRTYFDLFVVASLIHRRIPGFSRLYFPILGQYYYQSFGGLAANALAGMWSMFPPLFALPAHRESDRYSLDLLTALCARGSGHVLGIHPEGARNLDPDEYTFLKHKPGAGRIIHAARPIVIPTFIAGLRNDLFEQIRLNWEGGEPIRVWFDEPLDLSDLYPEPAKGSTYVAITDRAMDRVKALAELDRAWRQANPGDVGP